MEKDSIIFAIPKGRILEELRPIMDLVNLVPDSDFDHDDSRKLRFATNNRNVSIIRSRAFDIATFVAFGSVHLGVTGSDVLEEHSFADVDSPLDLGIGKCSLCVAQPIELGKEFNLSTISHLRVATKYPITAKRFFSGLGVQAECIKIGGAVELAPQLGLSTHIVDLVSTGRTLKENGLVAVEKISDVSTRLIVNRAVMKTHYTLINGWVEKFRSALNGSKA